MAKGYRCPRPPNRLLLHRAKNLHGPFFQSTGNACVKTVGNFLAPGMPGSGPQATSGVVLDANTIQVNFSLCVSVGALTGIQYSIDGGAWTTVTSQAKVTDTQWNFGIAPGVIDPGDDVDWRYVGGSGSILDCQDAEDIGDQQIAVRNPLVLAGNFILLETGGKNIYLLEDDIDQTSGLQTEDATP